jgi:hypothetical protein
MIVDLSPCRLEKLLAFLNEEGWLQLCHRADLPCYRSNSRPLLSAGTYFLWARCQFFVVQNLLRQELYRRYQQAKWYERRWGRIAAMRCALQSELAKRSEPLVSCEVTNSLWRHRAKITMPPQVTTILHDIHHYLLLGQPWSMPIGHLVPRNPGLFSATNASKQGIAVIIDTTQT